MKYNEKFICLVKRQKKKEKKDDDCTLFAKGKVYKLTEYNMPF